MPEQNQQKIKILIIDDDQDIADILKDFLASRERWVDICYDGLTGIELIQKTFYDLIIVDLVMPRVGGLDVLKYAKKTNPDVLVIIVTGYASVDTAISAIKEGAYGYLRKPFKLEEIKIAVDNAVDKIELYRENKELLKKLHNAYNELVILKQKQPKDEKITSINFYSSSMPSLHHLYGGHRPPAKTYIAQLQALTSLKESGTITESEFNTFKSQLLTMMDKNNPN